MYYSQIWFKCHKETPCVVSLNNQKCHFFLLLFFFKIGEQEGRTGPAWSVRVLVPVGEGRRWRNGEGR
jgi:hypothetical protein